MNRKSIIAAFAALLLSSGVAVLAQETSPDFLKALDLYERGVYDHAQVLFADIDDPMARGYEALCSIARGEEGYVTKADAFVRDYPESALCLPVNWKAGIRLFDDGRYADADRRLARFSSSDLPLSERASYFYRRGYAALSLGQTLPAETFLGSLLKLPYSDFTAPGEYAMGYIRYGQGDFAKAFPYFSEAAKDARFEDIAKYYMLECRFMQKDYDYVTEHASEMFNTVPEDRRPHLARIISESYLVKGDLESAREYYEKNLGNRAAKTRSDYFFAGSMLYAVKDYEGAVENFSQMKERTDSIGQIASYELAYSLIETKNKVAAMEAFRQASALDYDPAIKEDAYFNFAKLAFDLNHDTSFFTDYLKKYPEARKDRIYEYMAMAALYNHDYEGAVAAYDNIDDLDESMRSNYMKAYFMRASQLIGNGAWRDAVPCLKAAAYYVPRRDPFNQLSRFWLSEALFRNEEYSESRSVLMDLYNLSALDGREEGDLISYNIAYTYFKEGDYSSALKWFGNYLSAPSVTFASDAETRIGDCYFFGKDYTRAISAYERKLSDFPDPDDIYPYYRAGVAAGLLGMKDRKVRFLENVKEASASAPYYSEAMYELGRAYVATGDNIDAVRTFKSLRNTTSDNSYAARALIELGMIARNSGDYPGALSNYKQVVETMAGSDYAEDALLAIESIYQSTGEPEAYLAYVNSLGDKAGRDESAKENVYFNTAEQIFLSSDYNKAIPTFTNYLERFPQGLHRGQAEYYLAESNRILGNKDKAVDYYRAALTDGVDASFKESSLLGFADLSYSLGRYSDAYEGYSSLLTASRMEERRAVARTGMMKSAYRAHLYDKAIEAAKINKNTATEPITLRECEYILAKSYLETSRRTEAFACLEKLSKEPSTAEGAEASYLIIQNLYDEGRFSEVEDKVYAFAPNAGGQNYYLAKCFIVLGDSFMEQGNEHQAKATFESVRNGYSPVAGSQDDVLDQIDMRLKKLSETK